MGKMPDIKCTDCRGHCNHRGYPSVSKGSAFCQHQLSMSKKDYVKDTRWQKLKRRMGFKNIKEAFYK